MNTTQRIWVFDWDNTLVDSHAKGLDCMYFALQDLGLAITMQSLTEAFVPDYHAMFRTLGVPSQLWQEIDRRWLLHYQNDAPVALFPEARRTLEQLRQKDGRISLVTTGQRERVCRELELLALKHLFDFVICREDVARVKPAPDALHMLQRRYGDASLVYVGDHEADVAMARGAGVDWRRVDRHNAVNPGPQIIASLLCLL